MNLLPKRLRDARRAFGLTQADLARMSGLSQALVSHYETGARVPSDEIVGALAERLCVPVAWLRGDDEGLPIPRDLSPGLRAFLESDTGRRLNLSDADILLLARFDPFPGDFAATAMIASVRRGLGLDAVTGRPRRHGIVSIMFMDDNREPAGFVDIPRNALPRVLRAAGVEGIYVECEEVDDWSAFGEFDETLMPGGPRASGEAEGQGGDEGGPEG